MKKIVSAGIALLALTGTAAAADLPRKAPVYKAPPPIVDPWTWTGVYIGLNAGYSWGRSDTHVDYFTSPGGLPIVPPPGSITDVKFDLNGGDRRRPDRRQLAERNLGHRRRSRHPMVGPEGQRASSTAPWPQAAASPVPVFRA